jgi:aldehyde:ferredoxin oxidoreductase
MLDEYYGLRGWNDEGVPVKKTFEEFGLHEEWRTFNSHLEIEG